MFTGILKMIKMILVNQNKPQKPPRINQYDLQYTKKHCLLRQRVNKYLLMEDYFNIYRKILL